MLKIGVSISNSRHLWHSGERRREHHRIPLAPPSPIRFAGDRVIYDKAVEAGLEVHLITDSGRTEFHGQPTRTCLAIGREEADKIDETTGYLPLLQLADDIREIPWHPFRPKRSSTAPDKSS